MIKRASYLFCISFLAGISCFSQNLTFTGFTRYDEEPLPDAKIRVMQGNSVYTQTTSNASGAFTLKLDFGLDYKIYFEKENFTAMYAVIAGAVPEDKTHYKIKYEITVPFYHVQNEMLNHKAFEQPFTKISFDGKSKFIDDAEYIKAFMITLQTLPEKPVVVEKPKIIEKRYRIAGKVLNADAAKSPVHSAKVSLVDTNRKVVASTITNKFGTFCFPAAGAQSTFEIEVENTQGAAGSRIGVYTVKKEEVATAGKFTGNTAHYLNSPQTKLIEKLQNESYVPFLAGKLSAEANGESSVVAGKNVYLVSDKNEVMECTKTNVFGNFLFSKLSSGRNFTIGVDAGDSGLTAQRNVHLYSSKDIEIRKKDTLLNGKHLFKFLANDVNSYNELLVEDADVKMDLKGRLVAENENNPLKNIRIALLDNQSKVVDSTITDKNGRFVFKYLSYTNDLTLQIKDTNDLAGFINLIIYDNQGNMVKYITIRNSKNYKYKLLQGDLSRMDELYIDDPWLNLADKDFNKPVAKNMVIIENIYFEFNKADLLPAARQTLDKAILAMQSNPKMKIDISAHSDSKGSDDYNLKLSEQRAQSALDYIVSKNIDKARVTAKGFGETRLLNKCGNTVECPEEDHAKNRRLEFNISMK
jgi:outer membrane protein OmpA-like peptidoglycan-associated protein